MQPHDAGVYTKSYVTWNLGNIATYLQVPVYYTLETTPQAGDSSENAPGVRPCYRVPSTLCS